MLVLLCIEAFSSCTVSYKFNGASIDYTKIKSITLGTFANRAAYQWGPMASMFNTQLSDIYARQTKLTQVKRDGDMQITGEIAAYDQYNKSISSSGYSSMMELKITVKVSFVNNKDRNQDFEDRTFSASREFDASQSLESVQEDLVTEMIKEITEQIFNATVANW